MQTTFAQMVLDAEHKMYEECGEWVPSRYQEEKAMQPIADMLADMLYQDAKAFVMATWNSHSRMQRICIHLHRALLE